MSIADLIISIANKVKGIKDNVLAAYDAIASKNGEVPEVGERTVENLPATISKLQVKKPEVPIRSVTFIDFDGTVLYSYSVKEYAQLTELPAGPTHWEHLNFIGWTHTLEETQNNREQIIGARYELKEPDKMYFTIVVDNYECSITNASSVTKATIDWGDGSTDVFPTSYAVLKHRYAKNGEYNVCVYGDDIRTAFPGISCPITYNFSDILTDNSYYPYNPEAVTYPNYISKVIYRLGETLGTFVNFHGLEWIVMTDKLTATSINTAACNRLRGCNYNDNITTMNARSYQKCFQLCRVPNNSNFQLSAGNSGIKKIYIPNKVEQIRYANDLPVNNMAEIHIMRSIVKDGSITTLGTGNFGYVGLFFRKFYVPADSLEAYKTATNWSATADYIFPEEE